MRAAVLSSLFFALTASAMGFYSWRLGRTFVHRIWSLFNICVALTGFGIAAAILASNTGHAEFLWRLSKPAGIMIPALFAHFVFSFCQVKRKPFLIYAYGQAAAFSALFITGNVGFTLHRIGEIQYIHFNSAMYYVLFLNWTVCILYPFYVLIRELSTARDLSRRIQLKHVTFGFAIGFSAGFIAHWLPAFGIGISPAWNFLISWYVVETTYAIFRHRLMDLDLVVRRSIIYSMLFTCLTLVYLLLLILAESILRSSIGYHSLPYTFITVAAIALMAEPLRIRIQAFVDRSFFADTLPSLAEKKRLYMQEIAEQDRMRAVATLAAGMAHEIKNPITAIKTFAEFLPQKYADDEFRSNFQRIVTAEVNRINTIVGQLLDFAKPKPPQLLLQHLHPIIDDTLKLLSGKLVQHGITIETSYGEIPAVNVDKGQMRQVFLNLFLNAAEAMKHGGVLRISTASDSRGRVVVEISDTGTGIPKDDLPHIFEPFRSGSAGGTGLGLAIVYSIMIEHDAEITVESDLGRGTIFRLAFRAGCSA